MLILSITTIYAQNEKKEKFEVAGNCGMCKSRIEKAGHDTYDKLPGCCKYERILQEDPKK